MWMRDKYGKIPIIVIINITNYNGVKIRTVSEFDIPIADEIVGIERSPIVINTYYHYEKNKATSNYDYLYDGYDITGGHTVKERQGKVGHFLIRGILQDAPLPNSWAMRLVQTEIEDRNIWNGRYLLNIEKHALRTSIVGDVGFIILRGSKGKFNAKGTLKTIISPIVMRAVRREIGEAFLNKYPEESADFIIKTINDVLNKEQKKELINYVGVDYIKILLENNKPKIEEIISHELFSPVPRNRQEAIDYILDPETGDLFGGAKDSYEIDEEGNRIYD